ncbi:MAG: hypothetical protein DBY29_07500 [Coprobacillus sp.]|nr:MAG: hypothetical protein DBY29_07500 [Coprobacillus sp.]
MKRIIWLVLCAVMIVGLVAGCTTADNAVGAMRVNYVIQDDEKNEFFFMDREYAITADDAKVMPEEIEKAGKWLTDYILKGDKNNAFDFLVDGISFADDIKSWKLDTDMVESETKTDWTLTYTKAGQPLEVVVYATAYKNYAIIEWTVWINNVGNVNSGVISEFVGLDKDFGDADTYNITYWKGSKALTEDFSATNEDLIEGKDLTLYGENGKASRAYVPYFNIQWENEKAAWGVEGIYFSVGWPGEWYADIADAGESVHIDAGQKNLSTYLEPEEGIRSPLMTLLFWEKDLMRAQNFWRRWVYNEAMPQPNGEPIQPLLFASTAQTTALTVKATTENQIYAIQLWDRVGYDIDGWQMDAGWGRQNGDDWYASSGNWTADPERFEGGSLAAIADAVKEAGWDHFVLWHDLERISTQTDWHNKFKDTEGLIDLKKGHNLLNLADEETADMVTQEILAHLESDGVTIYRQDNCFSDTIVDNMNIYWKAKDAEQGENRNGITENKHLVNYLEYYDVILEYTGTFIDNCAGGGRRLDLETIKRSAALWRSDRCYDPTDVQCHSWGINFFLPYSGQGTIQEDPYAMTYYFRSNMTSAMVLPWRVDVTHLSAEKNSRYKAMIAEHRAYAGYMSEDYYPLSSYSKKEDVWMAWQFNDPDTSTGIIQVFRRTESEIDTDRFFLSGLEPDTTYLIENIDGGSAEYTGRELMCDGIQIHIPKADALILKYSPVR